MHRRVQSTLGCTAYHSTLPFSPTFGYFYIISNCFAFYRCSILSLLHNFAFYTRFVISSVARNLILVVEPRYRGYFCVLYLSRHFFFAFFSYFWLFFAYLQVIFAFFFKCHPENCFLDG